MKHSHKVRRGDTVDQKYFYSCVFLVQLIITYLQMLEMDKNAALAQRSWNFMNDSMRTNVFVRFTPETIACACIYLAARQIKAS